MKLTKKQKALPGKWVQAKGANLPQYIPTSNELEKAKIMGKVEAKNKKNKTITDALRPITPFNSKEEYDAFKEAFNKERGRKK